MSPEVRYRSGSSTRLGGEASEKRTEACVSLRPALPRRILQRGLSFESSLPPRDRHSAEPPSVYVREGPPLQRPRNADEGLPFILCRANSVLGLLGVDVPAGEREHPHEAQTFGRDQVGRPGSPTPRDVDDKRNSVALPCQVGAASFQNVASFRIFRATLRRWEESICLHEANVRLATFKDYVHMSILWPCG